MDFIANSLFESEGEMNIGGKVKVRENLTSNSVAFIQRGFVGIITKYEPNRTFPYFVDFGGSSNPRLDWFWEAHLEKLKE